MISSGIDPNKENNKNVPSLIKADQEKSFNKELEIIFGYKTTSPKNEGNDCVKSIDITKNFETIQKIEESNLNLQKKIDKNYAMLKNSKINSDRPSSDNLRNSITKMKYSKKIEKNSIMKRTFGNKSEHMPEKIMEISKELQPNLEKILNFQKIPEESDEIRKIYKITKAEKKYEKKSELNASISRSLEKIDDLQKKFKKNSFIAKQSPKRKSPHQNEEKNIRIEKILNLENRKSKKNTLEKKNNGKSLEKHDFIKISKMHPNLEMTENKQKEEIEKNANFFETTNNKPDKNQKINAKMNSKNIKLSLSGDYKESLKEHKKKEEGFFKYVIG